MVTTIDESSPKPFAWVVSSIAATTVAAPAGLCRRLRRAEKSRTWIIPALRAAAASARRSPGLWFHNSGSSEQAGCEVLKLFTGASHSVHCKTRQAPDMNEQQREQLGDELYRALIEQRTLPPLTDRYPDISIEDAYRISRCMLARRLAAGERVVGKKIGVTSRPVQEMLGVFQPDFGFLTDLHRQAAYPAPCGRRDRLSPQGRPERAGSYRGRCSGRHGIHHALLRNRRLSHR